MQTLQVCCYTNTKQEELQEADAFTMSYVRTRFCNTPQSLCVRASAEERPGCFASLKCHEFPKKQFSYALLQRFFLIS